MAVSDLTPAGTQVCQTVLLAAVVVGAAVLAAVVTALSLVYVAGVY